MHLIIFVFLSILSRGAFAGIYTDEDSDTIIIEAENDVQDVEKSAGDQFRTKRQFFQGSGFLQFLPHVINQPLQENILKNAPCLTRSGTHGSCRKITECYPFISHPEDGRNDTNHLAVFITENTGFCHQVLFNGYDKFNQKAEVFVDLFESTICCPSEKLKGRITTRPLAETPKISESGIEQGECGMRKISVIGQSETDPNLAGVCLSAQNGRHPWAASIRINNHQLCGASIIGKQHLITAAHCIAELSQSQFTKMNVLIGDGVIQKISKAFYHKNYDSKKIINDIAVLKMENPIEYSKYIQPICLPKEELIVEPSKAEYGTV